MNPKGLNIPAATGMPTRLYILANRKFRRILRTVFLDRSKQPITSSKSFCTTDANKCLLTNLLTYLFTYSLTHSLIYLLIYLLNPWTRVLLEKLTDFQLVKKFPAFYGT